jgi:hypothetical protein
LSAISLPAWRHESEKGSTKLHIAALVEPFDAKRERERRQERSIHMEKLVCNSKSVHLYLFTVVNT